MQAETWKPDNLTLWNAQGVTAFDDQSNYLGQQWAGFYCGPSTNRDADCLTRSNYRVIWAELQELDKPHPDDENEWTVVEEDCNHWACGWFKRILVHESNEPALRRLSELATALEDYPCADESDFSELECEEAEETWKWYSISDRVELCQQAGVSVFAARHECPPADNNGMIQDALLGH